MINDNLYIQFIFYHCYNRRDLLFHKVTRLKQFHSDILQGQSLWDI